MTHDHRAADRHPEQRQPLASGGFAGTAAAEPHICKVAPAHPRFDYRLKTLPMAGADTKAGERDLGRCLAEMRATLLELGHLMRTGTDLPSA